MCCSCSVLRARGSWLSAKHLREQIGFHCVQASACRSAHRCHAGITLRDPL